MKLQRHLPGQPLPGGSAVAIGNFDGIHRGHQYLLQRLIKHSNSNKLGSTVVIFEPQPMEFLQPDKAPARIMSLAGKLKLLQQLGIAHVLCLRFNSKLASMRASDFIKEVLCAELGAKALYIGENFRFGFRREGDVKLLRQAGASAGFTVETVAQLEHDNSRISSTGIRCALAGGDFSHALDLLGHGISIRGRITSGAGRGRTLGVPTLNMEPRHCPPLSGIFASRLHVNGNSYTGSSYLGLRPHYQDRTTPVLETHLFETTRDNMMGRMAEVELLDMVRTDTSFASEAELVQQINHDLDVCRKWHRENRS